MAGPAPELSIKESYLFGQHTPGIEFLGISVENFIVRHPHGVVKMG